MTDYLNLNPARLRSAHPDFQSLFAVMACSFPFLVICTHRPESEQRKVFLDGKSKVDWPDSKHNTMPSMAVDAIPIPVDWSDHKRIAYFAGQVMATARKMFDDGLMVHQLRWGGDWDRDTELIDNKFNDLVHYELITGV